VTPEDAWLDRRGFLRRLGLAGAGGLALGPGCVASPFGPSPIPTSYDYGLPEFARSRAFDTPHVADVTDELAAASYNNYYEFTTDKANVWYMARDFTPGAWSIEVSGECEAPATFSLDDLLGFPHEERVYRFRCVEAWSMVVPWVGFPLRALLEKVKPTRKARFVRLITLDDAARFPGQFTQSWYPWPYYEALTMAEATNELALLATGIYGHPLPPQHGCPVRLVTPWKYGYKNIKAIVKIELVHKKPPTFWSDLAGEEYDFDGNVRPDIPHPRWSQATDRAIPTGERMPTPMFNGYADQVGHLYRR
jgi:sulfoxide reductase catalytic subunit YedY